MSEPTWLDPDEYQAVASYFRRVHMTEAPWNQHSETEYAPKKQFPWYVKYTAVFIIGAAIGAWLG